MIIYYKGEIKISRKNFIERMYREVKEVNIVHVISRYIKLEKQGIEYLGICPFHTDKKIGSFKVNISKGMFKCFSCGMSGDSIDFVKNYKGIASLNAAAEIAIQEKIITQTEFDIYITNEIKYKRKHIERERKYKKKNLANILFQEIDILIVDKVYNIFLDNSVLNDIHRKELLEKRGLSNKTIEKRKYRSYPSDFKLNQIIKTLKKKFNNIDDILSQVPGFYQEKINNKWEWNISSCKGIIIPIRDVYGHVVGLQIKSDNGIDSKYYWVSS